MSLTIPLTQGQVTVIDESDGPLVLRHRWYAARAKSTGCYYAMTHVRLPNGRRTVLQMQRLIMGEPPGVQVDHWNGDTLDNRRANLRGATRSQNKANGPGYRTNRSGFKGVYWEPGRQRFHAQVRCDGVLVSAGRYATAEEAARAYDAKARELFGAFASLNLPES